MALGTARQDIPALAHITHLNTGGMAPLPRAVGDELLRLPAHVAEYGPGLLLAHAVHRGSWSALLPAAAFVAVVDGYQVRFEERALREKFGDEYDAYCAAVPRWLDQRSLSALRDLLSR